MRSGRRVLLAGMLMAAVGACVVGGGVAAAGASSHLSVTVVRDGLRLTVTVPNTVYPRGSLILASFTIGNLTGAPAKFAPSCVFGYTWPAGASPSGQNRYPPAFPPLFKSGGCVLSHWYDVSAIPAGYQATVRRYVVLRGRMLAFSMLEASVSGRHLTGLQRVVSDPLMVPLGPKTSHAPISFGMASGRVFADSNLPGRQVHVQAEAVCAGGDIRREIRWFVSGEHIAAPCLHLTTWRLAVGVVGQTVSVATYNASPNSG